ncbi:hypothetical protein ACNUDM_08390 [Vibrio chaetopteri]|uniref:hypothetical protein n=1 Tax=Vibrio chaetopteri TaxID=3016528 RepID=UPI003AB6A1A7
MTVRFFSIATLLLLTGCASTSSDEIACVFPDKPDIEAPAWVCNGQMPEGVEIGGVGYSQNYGQKISYMKQKATDAARAELANQMESRVSTLVKSSIEEQGRTLSASESVELQEVVISAMTTESSLLLEDSRIIRTITSPTGGMYALVGLSKASYDKNIALMAQRMEMSMPNLWKKFESLNLSKELEQSINQLKQQ